MCRIPCRYGKRASARTPSWWSRPKTKARFRRVVGPTNGPSPRPTGVATTTPPLADASKTSCASAPAGHALNRPIQGTAHPEATTAGVT